MFSAGMVSDAMISVKAIQRKNNLMNPYYIAACILVPALWGLLASHLYDRLDARRRSKSPDSQNNITSEMYHI
jgi:hypothetical protein